MRLEEEGNARDKIVEWGIRNLHSMKERIRKIFWSSHTMSKTTSFYFHIRVPFPPPPPTLHFDSIPRYKSNLFMECATLE